MDELILKLNQIYAKVNTLTDAVGGRVLPDKLFEKEYYRDFPVCHEDMPDFKEKFLALTKELDKESISTVVLMLKRLKQLKASENRTLTFFSKEETERILQLQDAFEKEIIRLSEGCYYYGGYMLPSPRFEESVFADRCGLGGVEKPESFAHKDIIDAGAFIGDSALILSELTDGKVYAFEPTRENYDNMLKTIELNSLANVVPCNLALGSSKGVVQMTNSIVSSTNAYVEKSTMPYTATETVEVVTLDEYVRENNLKVGLIKVDVEGAEQEFLKGAMETIKTQRPTLLISIYHNASDFYDIKPMLEKLNLGYSFKIRHPEIGTVMMETMLIAEAAGE